MALQQMGKNTEQARQYSTFYLADLFFGIDVLKVQEVLRYQAMTKVPLAPDMIEGLINLRGQIVTAVDLRTRLNLKPRAKGSMPMNIVVRTEDGAVSLLVDEISDVLAVRADSYEPAPRSLPPEQGELIEGVHKLDGRLLLILNTERVLRIKANGN